MKYINNTIRTWQEAFHKGAIPRGAMTYNGGNKLFQTMETRFLLFENLDTSGIMSGCGLARHVSHFRKYVPNTDGKRLTTAAYDHHH